MKQCKSCGEDKLLTAFSRDSRSKDGLQHRCKACFSLYASARYVPRQRVLKEDKLCNLCQDRKPRDDFYSSSNRCKPCEKERGASRKRSSTSPHVNHVKGQKRRLAAGDADSLDLALLRIIDGNACLRCGSKEALQWDHVIPVKDGGKTDIDNMQTLCQPCNGAKSATVADYRKVLTAS